MTCRSLSITREERETPSGYTTSYTIFLRGSTTIQNSTGNDPTVFRPVVLIHLLGGGFHCGVGLLALLLLGYRIKRPPIPSDSSKRTLLHGAAIFCLHPCYAKVGEEQHKRMAVSVLPFLTEATVAGMGLASRLSSPHFSRSFAHSIQMPGRFNEVDSFGREIVPNGEAFPMEERNTESAYPNEEDYQRREDRDRRAYRSFSHSRSRSRSYSWSHSYRRRHERKAWEVPFNPLALAHEGDRDRSSTRHRHKHRHHHHHHHHHSSDSEGYREFSAPKNTPADQKERWGHELYIEKVRAAKWESRLGDPESRARAGTSRVEL